MIEISIHYFIIILIISFLSSGLIIYFVLKKRINHFKMLSETDEMTKLLNYSAFSKILTKYIKQKRAFSFVLLDLNDFKQVNDKIGYNAGDKLLKETAQIIKSCLRTTDIIARYKIGDEFAVLLSHVNYKELEIICNRIIQHSSIVTLSIGASIFNSTNDNTDKIINRTETALRKAKNNKQGFLIT
jgi:diguanylate cyclase (GGDEF)-like protein